jgi:hypothetical protein
LKSLNLPRRQKIALSIVFCIGGMYVLPLMKFGRMKRLADS